MTVMFSLLSLMILTMIIKNAGLRKGVASGTSDASLGYKVIGIWKRGIKMDGKIFEKLIDVSGKCFSFSKPGEKYGITYASRKFYSMLQYSKEEFEEKYNNSLMTVILPEEKQKVKNLIARQFADGGTVKVECRVKRKDGTIAWLAISAKSILHMMENKFFCSCQMLQSLKIMLRVYLRLNMRLMLLQTASRVE